MPQRQPVEAGADPAKGTQAEFEAIYTSRLVVSAEVEGADRVLLVDDVCIHGSTVGVIAKALRGVEPAVEVITATAGWW